MWVSKTELSPAWVKEKCGIVCDKCTVIDISGESAPRSCFRLHFAPARPSLVLKQNSVLEDGRVHARHDLSLGTAREGFFYKHLASSLGELVPSVVYAEADLATGAKRVIMEDLAGFVDSGRLFGPTNPHNWKRDLSVDEERAGRPAPQHVASVTFRAYAQMHARFWRDPKLLEHRWLRYAEWVGRANQHSWQVSRDFTRQQWENGKQAGVRAWLDPCVYEAVEKAVAGMSWERQTARLNRQSHWTLVHGDCWPGNVMWHREGRVKLVDWEMVGVGSGAQDIGQYMITSVEPAVRRACEGQLVREYYDELVKGGVKDYSFKECWHEYTVGGVEKWLWFLCYLVGSPEMEEWAKAFHAQVLAFMKDHKVSADTIQQLRP